MKYGKCIAKYNKLKEENWMKKTVIGFIIFMIFLLAGCNSNNDIDTVENGSYVLEQEGTEAILLPYVKVSNDEIIFVYDLLSSYLSIGTYEINHGKLTMTTDDNKYIYVFEIDGDNLIFQESESSSVKLIDGRFGVKVTDKLIFRLKED